jgi:hypothetical protein
VALGTYSSILGLLRVATLEGNAMTLVLEALWGNQTLDLWCLGVWLLAFTLWLNLTANDELANLFHKPISRILSHSVPLSRTGDDDEQTYIILLGEAKELADLGGALWSETLWSNNVGKTWDIGLTLLDDGEGKDREIHGNDATTDGLALALTSAACAVAGVAIGEEKADTGWVHDSLLHWETLLIVASGDLEDVALELIADGVAWNLSAHAPIDMLALRVSLWISL